MQSIVKNVKTQQLNWASENGIAVDVSGYTKDRENNLRVPLSSASISEFDSADGGADGSRVGLVSTSPSKTAKGKTAAGPYH